MFVFLSIVKKKPKELTTILLDIGVVIKNENEFSKHIQYLEKEWSEASLAGVSMIVKKKIRINHSNTLNCLSSTNNLRLNP